MGKAARNKKLKAEGKDRGHTVVSKETNPQKMNNPANARKATALNRARAKDKRQASAAATR